MNKALILACLVALVSLSGSNVLAAEPPDAASLNADEHLAGWWTFDEDSGTTAKDSSKHGRDAKLSGDLSFDGGSVPGRIGKALKIDGSKGLVEVPGYKGVEGTAARTVCLWIRTKTSRGDVVLWGTQDFGQMWILRFIRGHVGVTPHGGYYYMEDSVHDEAWHHVGAVVGEAELPNLHDDVTLYLDGQVAQPDRIGLLDLWPIETGAEQDVAVGKGFQGEVDDLRIYDRALSDEEIKALFDMKK